MEVDHDLSLNSLLCQWLVLTTTYHSRTVTRVISTSTKLFLLTTSHSMKCYTRHEMLHIQSLQ